MKKLLSLTAGAAFFASAVAAQAGGIDVVIGIDESGSMGPAINNVKTNVGTIYDALPAGSHVGLVGYGTSSHCGGNGQIPHIHTPATTDRNIFYDSVDDMIASGGLEEGYRLVYEMATDTIANGWNSTSNTCTSNPSLGFTGTQHCQIVITDEPLNQNWNPAGCTGCTQQEAIDALQNNGGIFFGILRSPYAGEGQPLAAATGGQVFDFDAFIADPTPVINAVLAACVEAIDPLNLAADDGLDLDAGECIPANRTDITYTVSYENTNQDTVPGVQVSHTDGTWGGTSWTWSVGDVAAGASGTNPVTLPLGTLTPGTTFTNRFTLTSTNPDVRESTVTEETLVCPNTPPEAQCQDVTLYLDANGEAVLTPSQVDNGSSDPDGDPLTFSLSTSNFSCSDVGTQHAVTLTVTDDEGLSDSCVANVTVVDNTAPTNVQANAQATMTPPDAPISFTATAEDNCSVAVEITDYSCYKVKKDGSQQSKMESCVVSLSGDTITISDSGGVGDNIVWNIVAADQSGNETTAEGRVSVINPGGSNGKGNNGVGNGEDPQPRGNPPINDGAGTSPGNPGNKKK